MPASRADVIEYAVPALWSESSVIIMSPEVALTSIVTPPLPRSTVSFSPTSRYTPHADITISPEVFLQFMFALVLSGTTSVTSPEVTLTSQ